MFLNLFSPMPWPPKTVCCTGWSTCLNLDWWSAVPWNINPSYFKGLYAVLNLQIALLWDVYYTLVSISLTISSLLVDCAPEQYETVKIINVTQKLYLAHPLLRPFKVLMAWTPVRLWYRKRCDLSNSLIRLLQCIIRYCIATTCLEDKNILYLIFSWIFLNNILKELKVFTNFQSEMIIIRFKGRNNIC